jgi:hypothetical protein
MGVTFYAQFFNAFNHQRSRPIGISPLIRSEQGIRVRSGLANFHHLINLYILKLLHPSAGPMNLDELGNRFCTQAKAHQWLA